VNDYWVVLLALVSLVAVAGGLLLAAWTRGRLGLASGALFALAIAAWIVDFVAVANGLNDADGFVDCGRSCTPTHRLAALGFIAPPLLIALAASGMVIARFALARDRRERA
jgi:hypothetical protein